jgi:hypothetical protein
MSIGCGLQSELEAGEYAAATNWAASPGAKVPGSPRRVGSARRYVHGCDSPQEIKESPLQLAQIKRAFHHQTKWNVERWAPEDDRLMHD